MRVTTLNTHTQMHTHHAASYDAPLCLSSVKCTELVLLIICGDTITDQIGANILKC